jgi:hypothetical protein
LRKLRRHVKRRWWLWMVRPIARRFQPRTKGPLHEQPEIGKQLERYSEAVASEEPILVAGPESSSHVPPHPGIR